MLFAERAMQVCLDQWHGACTVAPSSVAVAPRPMRAQIGIAGTFAWEGPNVRC